MLKVGVKNAILESGAVGKSEGEKKDVVEIYSCLEEKQVGV